MRRKPGYQLAAFDVAAFVVRKEEEVDGIDVRKDILSREECRERKRRRVRLCDVGIGWRVDSWF
jgi:hypothetical protein